MGIFGSQLDCLGRIRCDLDGNIWFSVGRLLRKY